MKHVYVMLLLAVSTCGEVAPTAPAPVTAETSVQTTELADGLKFPWGMAFLPDGGIVITEKTAGLRLYREGRLGEISGAPRAYVDADSGLLDVALDPEFATNSRLYLSFVEGDAGANHTALYRARLDGGRLTDGKVIYRNGPDKKGPSHPGGRIAFLPDKTLLLTLGEGYDYKQEAQNPASGLGKIVQLDRDGKVIGPGRWFSVGHRNPQGLAFDAATNTIFEHEHGPKGGDEINILVRGANYGWPKTTHGIDYDGNQISKLQTAKGVTDPVLVWVPSIAPSGLTVYSGDRFPSWRGDLFVGALAGRHLRRIQLEGGKEVAQEILLRDLGARIRDVRTGPDGFLYLLTDDENGKLIRVEPAS